MITVETVIGIFLATATVGVIFAGLAIHAMIEEIRFERHLRRIASRNRGEA